jgi:signal recognition particle subunit SRP54
MMGLGGGMAMPTPEQIAAMQKSAGVAPSPAGGIPSAPPPGAFNLPPQFPGLPGLGAPRFPGLGGGLPFGGKKK